MVDVFVAVALDGWMVVVLPAGVATYEEYPDHPEGLTNTASCTGERG